MIEINVIPRNKRSKKFDTPMYDLQLRIKTHFAKLAEVATKCYCKKVHWQGNSWCKVTGKLSPEDKAHNLRMNARLKEVSQQYIAAWDNLHKAGQEQITIDDLKQFINGTHSKCGAQGHRLTLDEAIKIFLKHKAPRHKTVIDIKSQLMTMKHIIESVGGVGITLDNINERIAFSAFESLCDKSFTYNGKTEKYAYKTRSLYVNRMRNLFKFFETYEHKLKKRPILPKSNPFYLIDVFQTNDEQNAEKLRDVHFYSTSEIQQIEQLKLDDGENYYRNILLWQIYTGYSFIDISAFNPEINIDKKDAVVNWITQRRIKTNVLFEIPIERKIQNLIDYFRDNLPPYRITNDSSFIRSGSTFTYRKYLTILGEKLGFKLTATHKGRHTFAVNALNKGYQMEELSFMLGHTDVATTAKYYGSITRDRVQNRRNALLKSNLFITPDEDTKTGTAG